MLLTEVRTTASGVTEYFCLTDGWVEGRLWDGDGCTRLACEYCGVTLDDDYEPPVTNKNPFPGSKEYS